MRGRLEREIRLLPQVLSCSFTQDDVVVLADLSADADAIRSATERILERAGETATVRVIGPSINDPIPSRALTPLLATASVAGVAVLGVGALVGGLVAIDHPKIEAPERPQTVQAAAAPEAPDIRNGLGGLSFGDQKPPGAPPVPGEIPAVVPRGAGIAAEAVSLPRALAHEPAPEPEAPQGLSCDNPPARGAPWARHGKHLGGGPTPWSRSVLVPPHSCDERGRSS